MSTPGDKPNIWQVFFLDILNYFHPVDQTKKYKYCTHTQKKNVLNYHKNSV